MIRSILAPRIVVLLAGLIAASASALLDAGEPILVDGFESDRLYEWSTAVGLADGEVCYRPDSPVEGWTEWSGTCAPGLLCCGCGIFPCELKCYDGEVCPVPP